MKFQNGVILGISVLTSKNVSLFIWGGRMCVINILCVAMRYGNLMQKEIWVLLLILN